MFSAFPGAVGSTSLTQGGVAGTLGGTVTLSGAGTPVAGGVIEVWNQPYTILLATIVVDGSGAFTQSIAPGVFTLRYQPPFAYALGPSEPDTHSVTVSPAQTTTQAFVAQAALYADDFQSYTSVAQLTNTSGSPPPAGDFFSVTNGQIVTVGQPAQMALDTTGGPSSSKAMRYTWVGGDAATTVGIAARLNPPPLLSSLWVRWTDQLSAAFKAGNTTNSASEYKYLKLQINHDYGTGLPQIASYLEYSATASSGLAISIDAVDRNGHSSIHYQADIPASALARYNTWVFGITGLGSSTCDVTLYLNGVALLVIPTMPFLPGLTVGGAGEILLFELGANINTPVTLSQQRWFREFGAYLARPSLLPLVP